MLQELSTALTAYQILQSWKNDRRMLRENIEVYYEAFVEILDVSYNVMEQAKEFYDLTHKVSEKTLDQITPLNNIEGMETLIYKMEVNKQDALKNSLETGKILDKMKSDIGEITDHSEKIKKGLITFSTKDMRQIKNGIENSISILTENYKSFEHNEQVAKSGSKILNFLLENELPVDRELIGKWEKAEDLAGDILKNIGNLLDLHDDFKKIHRKIGRI